VLSLALPCCSLLAGSCSHVCLPLSPCSISGNFAKIVNDAEGVKSTLVPLPHQGHCLMRWLLVLSLCVAALISELHGAAQSSSALSFLAQTVKDHGPCRCELVALLAASSDVRFSLACRRDCGFDRSVPARHDAHGERTRQGQVSPFPRQTLCLLFVAPC
jgi:hypothetical protein